MLDIQRVHTYYGLSHVLFGISLQVKKGEIVCILGRNGAGKTTTMRSIMGLTPPRQGNVLFKGKDITKMPVYEIARLGMGFVPDNRRIFPDLTVGENLEIASKGNPQGNGWNKERVYRLFPALKSIDSRKGGFCSGGEQQMLSIARSLMGNPDFLLLDEPTDGLAPLVVRELMDQIESLKKEGLSILMAEQNVKSALKLADRVYVIDRGQIRFQGSITELEDNKEIREKYLLI